MAGAVARRVRDALAEERLTFAVAGSCHVGLGSVAGLGPGARGVVWLDAHGDFNTPDTTGSGLVDGTVLATITGRCWRRLTSEVPGFPPVPDENVVLAGVRSLDPGEEELLDRSRVTVISPETLSALAPPVFRDLGERTDAVYLHVDLDVLDASVGRANAFAGPGGLSGEDLLELAELIARGGRKGGGR